MSILKPLASNYLTLPDNNNVETAVNFVVPITKVNNQFVEFMSMYEAMYLQLQTSVYVVPSGSQLASAIQIVTTATPRSLIVWLQLTGFLRSA